jgi:hypothetical protein
MGAILGKLVLGAAGLAVPVIGWIFSVIMWLWMLSDIMALLG